MSGILTLLVAYGMFATAGWAWLLTVIVMVVRIAADARAVIAHGIGSAIVGVAVVNLVISAPASSSRAVRAPPGTPLSWYSCSTESCR